MQAGDNRLAGLDACVIGDPRRAKLAVVLLHGYATRAADLTPFAHSLAIPHTLFVVPQGPIEVPGGNAWWPRAAPEDSIEPRDLADWTPSGRPLARALIRGLITELAGPEGRLPVLLAGFSQGGMLACDVQCMEEVTLAGLALMSASRIGAGDWRAQRAKLKGLRVLVSHGRADRDLEFAAGERLQRFLRDCEAKVTWVPFDGGHEIPFRVWREFRRFVQATVGTAASTHENEAVVWN